MCSHNGKISKSGCLDRQSIRTRQAKFTASCFASPSSSRTRRMINLGKLALHMTALLIVTHCFTLVAQTYHSPCSRIYIRLITVRPYADMAAGDAWLPYIWLLFSSFSNVCHSVCVWPTALKLSCINNFDMLFLVMGFTSLVDEIQFMLISSRHIWIRYMKTVNKIKCKRSQGKGSGMNIATCANYTAHSKFWNNNLSCSVINIIRQHLLLPHYGHQTGDVLKRRWKYLSRGKDASSAVNTATQTQQVTFNTSNTHNITAVFRLFENM